ncbi:MAG TPA: ACP S-malonyltransferase, partial [Kiloniellaceae bacterium]|nr:ACP S-malonyltransferase [Kiloniellaceae bacterium]
AMQAAVPVGAGAMAAVLGLDVAQLEAIAAEASDNDEICAAANDNAPGQVVISGHKAAVERAVELAKAAGAKRAVLLSVSAPFHCPLMAPAADRMAAALAEVAMQSPQVPLMANVTAQAERDPTQIKSLLVQQVTGMVRWRESVMALATAGVGGLVELGAGKVLSGLTRRIDGALTSVNAGSPAEIEALLERLNS